MKKEKSCGAIVYREKDGVEILLIKHKNGGHWAFPQGPRGEQGDRGGDRPAGDLGGDRPQGQAGQGLPPVVAYSPKPNVWKDVIYFAALCDAGKTHAQPEEVLELRWEPPFQALQTVTYDSDREILQSFLEYYQKKA